MSATNFFLVIFFLKCNYSILVNYVTLLPARSNQNNASVTILDSSDVITTATSWNIVIQDQISFQMLIKLAPTWVFHPTYVSTLRLTINSSMEISNVDDCDLYIAWSDISNTQFFTTGFRMDKNVARKGNIISPMCDTATPPTNSMHFANFSSLVNSEPRKDLSTKSTNGGEKEEMLPFAPQYPLYPEVWPITIELENDPINNIIYITHYNPTWGSFKQKCGFANTFPSSNGLQIYIGGDDNAEKYNISSFTIELEINTPSPTNNPTPSPTYNPTQATPLPTYNPTSPSNTPTESPTADPYAYLTTNNTINTSCNTMSVTILDVNEIFDPTIFNGLYILDKSLQFGCPKWIVPQFPSDKNIQYNGFAWNINGIGDNTLSYVTNNNFPPNRNTNAEWKHSSVPHTFNVFMYCVDTISPTINPPANNTISNSSISNNELIIYLMVIIGACACVIYLMVLICVKRQNRAKNNKVKKCVRISVPDTDNNNNDIVHVNANQIHQKGKQYVVPLKNDNYKIQNQNEVDTDFKSDVGTNSNLRSIMSPFALNECTNPSYRSKQYLQHSTDVKCNNCNSPNMDKTCYHMTSSNTSTLTTPTYSFNHRHSQMV